jgi:putative aldouronate transport system substrate-binding protein
MYIQKKIADALGVDPRSIKTQDEFYDLLVKIKEGGFTDDNGNLVYPLGPKYWGGSVDALKYVATSDFWGVKDRGEYFNIDADGSVKHEAETDYAYAKINFVRKLLAEGLMNPEFFTMDTTRAEEVSRTHNSAIMADVHNYEEIIYGSDDWVPLGPLSDRTGDNAEIVGGNPAAAAGRSPRTPRTRRRSSGSSTGCPPTRAS